MIHLLAYQSTFINTGTSCSPPQNFLHFTLHMCDFPDFWAIPFDRKVIFLTKEKMNSNISVSTFNNTRTCSGFLHTRVPSYKSHHKRKGIRKSVLLSTAELPTFYIAKVRFSWFLSHPFWYKSHFFTKEEMNSKICHDTLVGIPEYLHKHQDVLLSTAELPTFNIAKVRFSRFLSHPFWHKSHSFHKRKDEFENLSRYTCWHTRVPSQTPGRVASPSQNFLHFTLQKCNFPDFWAIPFDTKVIFFTKEKMNSKICHDTLVGIPEYLHKHQDVLLSTAELPTFYIANVRFSRFLSHPFW